MSPILPFGWNEICSLIDMSGSWFVLIISTYSSGRSRHAPFASCVLSSFDFNVAVHQHGCSVLRPILSLEILYSIDVYKRQLILTS